MIIQIIIATLICVIVPILVGDLFLPEETIIKQYIMGLFGTLAVSQLLFLPFIIFQHNFTPYFITYVLIIGGVSVYSVVKRYKSYGARIESCLKCTKNNIKPDFWMICAVVLIGVQVIRVAVGHFFVYADNVLYIPYINDILETDKDYFLDYTYGIPGAKEYNIKYLFTSYFPYLASICKISGLHPAVLVQTILPVILTLVTYNLVWHYGMLLLKDRRASWMLVLFFGILAETIGGYDHTQANSVVSGIYFGKKIVFLILIPFIMLYIAEHSFLLEDEVKQLKAKDIFLLLIMVTGTCAPSLMGTGLAPIVLLLMGIVLAIRRKSIIPFFQMLIPVIPSIVILSMVVYHLYFRQG